MAATTLVPLSAAVANNRFSAEFFDPQYVFHPKDPTAWLPIGRTLQKCEYGISVAMNTNGSGYPMFRMNELDNCLALRPEKHADIPSLLFEQYRLKRGDVLFNRTNSFEFVGRAGIVLDQTDCTFASYLIRLVPNPDIVLPEYLAVYLNTDFGVGQVRRRAMRSINQANVSGSEIRRVLLPVIDKTDQQLVADRIQDAHSSLRESAEQYQAAIKLVEHTLGIDQIDLRNPNGFIARSHEISAANRLDADFFHPVYRQLDLAASEFPIYPIRRISGPLETGEYSPSYANCGRPYIRGVNLRRGYVDDRAVFRTQALSPSSRNTVNNRDILVTRVGSIGTCGLVDERFDGAFFSDNLIRIRLSSSTPNPIPPEVLNIILNSAYGQLQMTRYSRGSVQQRLNQTQLACVPVPELPKPVQDRIVRLVDSERCAYHRYVEAVAQAKAHVERLIEEAIEQ